MLTFNDGVLFRTKLFEPDYRYTLNFVDAWSVDEVILLDVSRTGAPLRDRTLFFKTIEEFARRCFVPLTVGGGIRSMEDVRRALASGADKVTVNTGALAEPELITQISSAYGSQCVVLSIDTKKVSDGSYHVYGCFGTSATGRTVDEWAREGISRGAGEILVTSIERDGSLHGYDLDLCRQVTGAVGAPVLICGGAGNWSHFLAGIKEGGADGVCTTNIYHFTETAIKSAKSYLQAAGVAVRI
ncbi:MAG TPA: imidazole glycerol phosphate synthase cyclase subunit [Candidatus Acidoferrales bacterium]|nr:imidazole glycerol phosphate synthase cyclase subunit [Candidatus Acidoferrales bacterium]